MVTKKMVEIPLKAEVRCQDKECGHVAAVIFNPATEELTHFVLRTDDLAGNEYLVPVDLIESSAGRILQLHCSSDELARLEPFQQTSFVDVDPLDYPHLPDVLGGGYYEWPYVQAEGGYTVAVRMESVPAHELAVHRGATVQGTDGKVGRVDEFLIDPQDNRISHLVLSHGHLWGKRDVVIPVTAIERIADDTVYLKLDKTTVEKLPQIPLRRNRPA